MSEEDLYHKADFLWPNAEGSVDEAGFEFANANTEEYRKHWWEILKYRLATGVVKS